MISRTTKRFRKLLSDLLAHVQKQAFEPRMEFLGVVVPSAPIGDIRGFALRGGGRLVLVAYAEGWLAFLTAE